MLNLPGVTHPLPRILGGLYTGLSSSFLSDSLLSQISLTLLQYWAFVSQAS